MGTAPKSGSKLPAPSVYEQVANFTHAYFGHEAVHYVGRLIEVHTRKKPEQLSRDELMSLLDWIKGAVAFFATDKELLERYMTELFDLAGGAQLEDFAEG